jgi:hypothetical protein
MGHPRNIETWTHTMRERKQKQSNEFEILRRTERKTRCEIILGRKFLEEFEVRIY